MINYTNNIKKLHELKSKSLYIFDMDGTVYLGDKPLPNAVNLIEKINNQTNKRVIFFTNNASKSSTYYYEKLKKLGFSNNSNNFDNSVNQVLSSADITINFLQTHRKNKRVFLLGTPYLESMFKESSIILTPDMPDIVVTSFDMTLTYEKLAKACTFIRNGAEWLTTHPDINCPVENGGYIPDCGAINELIRVSTGRALPKAFGKPYGEVVDMMEAIYGEKRENMAMFGDRLYTDIALGKQNNMTAVLLLTGEATLEEAMNLPPELQPDIIFDNLIDAEKYLI